MDQRNVKFIKEYYSDPTIREIFFNQASRYSYAIGTGQALIEKGWTFPVKEVGIEHLGELLDDGLDIFFPLRTKDEKSFYILWDIEYFNTEYKKFIFDRENHRKVFEWIAPTLYMVEEILRSFKIGYVIDTTMSGIHVWMRISSDSAAFRELANEGTILPSLAEKYSQVFPNERKRNKPYPLAAGKAYNAAGKILEYFTHILIKKSKLQSKLPVTVSDTPQFGECYPYSGLSSDLTQYAHPVYMRCMRAIGSIHQKSVINGFNDMGPAIDIVKLPGMSYEDVVKIMWDASAAVSFYKKNFPAGRIDVPDASYGWLNAINAYKKNNLRVIHKKWEGTVPSSEAPVVNIACINENFNNSNANPLLLTPSNLQMLAEFFARKYGVSVVKKIFNDIADRYYLNNGLKWYNPFLFTGIDWNKYDARTAVDFWGRIYWSIYSAGLGRGSDCSMIRNIGCCPLPDNRKCADAV